MVPTVVQRHACGGAHDTFGASPSTSPSRPRQGGHRPRGGGATGQGVEVPPYSTSLSTSSADTVGALGVATQTRLRLLFFTFFTTFVIVLTLQVFHHHVQVC